MPNRLILDKLLRGREYVTTESWRQLLNRYVLPRAEHTIAVTEYGALGDGSHDDSTAIQNAIDAAPSNGARIVFAPGTYLISTTINILQSGIHLVGTGPESCRIICPAGAIGINFNGTVGLKGWGGMRGLHVTRNVAAAFATVQVKKWFIWNAEDCEFAGGGPCLDLTDNAQHIRVHACVIDAPVAAGSCIELDNSISVQIIGNSLEPSGTDRYAITVGASNDGVTIEGNVAVDGNMLIRGTGGFSDNITIVGNVARGLVYGIDASTLRGSTVVGNTLQGGGAASSWGIRLQAVHTNAVGNTCKNFDKAGIWLDNASDCVVVGNNCYDDQTPKTQAYGIREDGAGPARNTIALNNCYGNLTGPIWAAGTTSTAFLTMGLDQPLLPHYGATATWDPPNLASGAQQSTTITVIGAQMGDTVEVAHTQALSGTRLWGEVTASDTVTVYHRNDTGIAVDVGSGTLRASVQRRQ